MALNLMPVCDDLKDAAGNALVAQYVTGYPRQIQLESLLRNLDFAARRLGFHLAPNAAEGPSYLTEDDVADWATSMTAQPRRAA